MRNRLTEIFGCIFTIFIFSTPALGGYSDSTSLGDNRTSMEVESDVLWIRVEGDNFHTIDVASNLISYKITTGEEYSRFDISSVSTIMDKEKTQCSTAYNLQVDHNEECILINGDFSNDFSQLHLTVCSAISFGVGKQSMSTTFGLAGLDECEFLSLDRENNLISKFYSQENYSVTYRTENATYRMYSNFTVENLESGALGNLSYFSDGTGVAIFPPYIFYNSTIGIQTNAINPTWPDMVFIDHNEVNGSIEVDQWRWIERRGEYGQFIGDGGVDGFTTGDNCAGHALYDSSPLTVTFESWDTFFLGEIQGMIENPAANLYEIGSDARVTIQTKTIIAPSWFLTRISPTDCLPYESYYDQWTKSSPYDYHGDLIIYHPSANNPEQNNGRPCTIVYGSDSTPTRAKIWSCGVHDGVVYQWDSSNNLVESPGGFHLWEFLVALIILLSFARMLQPFSSESDITSLIPLQENGSSPRSSSYKGNDIEGILSSVSKLFPKRGFSELPILTQIFVAVMELEKLGDWRQIVILYEYALRDPELKDMDRILVQGGLLEAKKNLNSSTDLFKEWQKLQSHGGGNRCSVGTGFWGTKECGEIAKHLCQRCMKYACRSHITTQRTYAGEAVCNTCNLGMQDDA